MLTLWNTQLVYVDDLHLLTAGPDKFLILWIVLAAYEVVGTPFAYHKFKGGVEVDYIGYHVSYATWSAGVSDSHAPWIISWISNAEESDWIVVGRTVIELTGRLTFVARILTWLRPFLAPLHSWTSVLARETACRMPALVHSSLVYIRTQLLEGRRLVPAPVKPSPLKQAFRTDAKCELGRVVLGGWLLGVDADPATAKWFCVELTPGQVPWLFTEDGSSQWASSSAELLATYMACVAFASDLCVSACILPAIITAGTDNRSNPQALEKGSSMKWPLMGMMMQFASYLASRGGRVKLQWRPREENVEADDLTNCRFDHFDLSLRLDVSFEDLPMSIFDSLQAAQAEFAELKAVQKSHAQKSAPTSKKQKLSEKTAW